MQNRDGRERAAISGARTSGDAGPSCIWRYSPAAAGSGGSEWGPGHEERFLPPVRQETPGPGDRRSDGRQWHPERAPDSDATRALFSPSNPPGRGVRAESGPRVRNVCRRPIPPTSPFTRTRQLHIILADLGILCAVADLFPSIKPSIANPIAAIISIPALLLIVSKVAILSKFLLL